MIICCRWSPSGAGNTAFRLWDICNTTHVRECVKEESVQCEDLTRLASSKEATRGRGGEARGVRVERVLGVWQSERSMVGEERAYVLIPRSLCECAVHACTVPLA